MGNLDRVEFGGEIVDRRTAEMLTEAEQLAQAKDPSIKDFVLNQGCFCNNVSASAGTHSGAGAFDLSSRGYDSDQERIIGLALRRVGFASWLRDSSQGNWGEHWHGIAMGSDELPEGARNQVQNYLDGRTGLRGGGMDDQPRPEHIRTWEEYQEAEKTPEASQAADVDDQPAADPPEQPGPPTEAEAPTEPPAGDPPPAPPAPVDTDADGLTDDLETLAGTDKENPDSDQDGLADGYEGTTSHTDPLSADGDADGQSDADELAAASDPGLLPGVAGVVGTGVLAENVRDGVGDADQDGVSNRTEKLTGTEAKSDDSDSDQVDDSTEIAIGTDPTRADSDHDGFTDGREIAYGLNPLSPVMGPDGRLVTTERWTPEAAAQRLLEEGQGQPDRPDQPKDEPVTMATSATDSATENTASENRPIGEIGAGNYGDLRLSPRMAEVASTILATTDEVGRAEGWDESMRERASIIAVATAMKESWLGDDPETDQPNQDQDAGVFQQRVKPGWYGTLDQVNDVEYATRAFLLGHKVEKTIEGGAGDAGYRIPGLAQIDDWQHLSYSEASHQVQRSAFPQIKAKFIAMAKAVYAEAGEQAPDDPGPAPATDLAPAATQDEDAPVDLSRLPGADEDDPDTDNDGLTDAFEKLAKTDLDNPDTDGDGRDDGFEALSTRTDPLRADDDPRQDRLPGVAGVIGSGAFARNARNGLEDSDGDGVSDDSEKLLKLDAKRADTDHDKLDDATELAIGTNPRIFDTDADGFGDGLESQRGSNPLDPESRLGVGVGTGLTDAWDNGTTPADLAEWNDANADTPVFNG